MFTAIILAAGRSSRMGTLKQLLPWRDGRTILETVVHTALTCSEIDDEVRVVLGSGADKTRAALHGLIDPRLRLLENQDFNRGMLSSIQVGIRDLPSASEGFWVFLGDQPLIAPELVWGLAEQWLRIRPDFLVPFHGGRRGHPVIISKKYVPEILAMGDEEGGLRSLLRRYPQRIAEINVDSAAIYIDLDYPEDYRKYLPGGEEQ